MVVGGYFGGVFVVCMLLFISLGSSIGFKLPQQKFLHLRSSYYWQFNANSGINNVLFRPFAYGSQSRQPAYCRHLTRPVTAERIFLASLAATGPQMGSMRDESTRYLSSYVGIPIPPQIRSYVSSMKLQPLLTKSATSFAGFVLGDFIAQMFTNKAQFSLVRLLRMGLFGALIHAPLGHTFYRFLNGKFASVSPRNIVVKVAIDQIAWMPIFSTLLIAFDGIVAGASPHFIGQYIQQRLAILVLTSWLIWPVSHAANFYIIPAKQRLVFINLVQIFHNTVASLLIH